MFGWFRKTEKQVPNEKLVGAFETGRRAAATANADLEAYMRSRFYPHIKGLVDKVFGDFETPEMPPLVVARVDLKNFVDGIDDLLRPRVIPQLREATAEWLGVFQQLGAIPEFEDLIEHKYAAFKSSVVLAAFQKLLDLTDMLKAADDKWRAANPEKAGNIPVDLLGSELADVLHPYLKA